MALLHMTGQEKDDGKLRPRYQHRTLGERMNANRTTAKRDVSARSSAKDGTSQPSKAGSKVEVPEAPAAAGQKRKSEEEATGTSKRAKPDVLAKPSVRTGARPSSNRPSSPKSRRDAPMASATDTRKPRGLFNYRKVDFANAVVQCLARCDGLVNHCKPMGKNALTKVEVWDRVCEDFDPADSAGRLDQQGRDMRKILNDKLMNRTSKL